MRHVGMLEAKTHLSSLVADVEGGETVVLTRNGRAVAKIVSISREDAKPRLSGPELAERFRQLREHVARNDPFADMSWDEVVACAKKEGTVTIYHTTNPENVDFASSALKEEYGISLLQSRDTASETVKQRKIGRAHV